MASEMGPEPPQIHGEMLKLEIRVSEGFPHRRWRKPLEIPGVRPDTIFSAAMVAAVGSMGLEATRTSYQSPWQNEWPNDSWVQYGESCSTTSLSSMTGTFGAYLQTAWPTTAG